MFAELHINNLPWLFAADQSALVDIDAALVGLQPTRVFVAGHALGQQIIQTGAQILAAC